MGRFSVRRSPDPRPGYADALHHPASRHLGSLATGRAGRLRRLCCAAPAVRRTARRLPPTPSASGPPRPPRVMSANSSATRWTLPNPPVGAHLRRWLSGPDPARGYPERCRSDHEQTVNQALTMPGMVKSSGASRPLTNCPPRISASWLSKVTVWRRPPDESTFPGPYHAAADRLVTAAPVTLPTARTARSRVQLGRDNGT